jgi:hypothetical protein
MIFAGESGKQLPLRYGLDAGFRKETEIHLGGAMAATMLEPRPTTLGPVQARRSWVWYLSTFIICAHFGLSYVGRQISFRDLKLYTEGRLGVPFQYRTLVAWIFRGLVSSQFFLFLARHAPSLYKDPYLLAYLLVTIVALGGSVLATSDTIRRLTDNADFARWSAFLVVFMAYFTQILMYGLVYTLPYDVPSLFFFCMGINLIVRKNPWLYYLLFIPAVFNRETICFLTVFFAVWEWFRLEDDLQAKVLRILPHVAAQAAIWIAIKVYLFKLYAHNPSDITANRVFQNNLAYDLKELATPGQWPLLLSLCGFTLPLLIAQRRWIGNRQLAWACGIVLPLWFFGMMCAGVIVEIRIFTELAAIAAPAVALILYHRYYRHPTGELNPAEPRPG